ncbi:MAG: hypothetical protein JSR26_04065 [Proteobacteria bacterium]|nr:hypothetical protein [Pseudomonadota bacterium]
MSAHDVLDGVAGVLTVVGIGVFIGGLEVGAIALLGVLCLLVHGLRHGGRR